MAVSLKIVKSDGSASVSVSLNVGESRDLVDFRNTAMAGVAKMGDPIHPSSPFLTYLAIECACISAAIYARRKLGVVGLFVELISFSYTGRVENADPFAKAVMIAICKSMSESIAFSENDLNGWREAPP